MTAAATLRPNVPTPEPLFYPAFDCGCRPYLEAFSYDAWRQYRRQVKRGERAKRIPDVRDRLFCQCQVKPLQERALRVAKAAPASQVAADPEPAAEMSESEKQLYNAAQSVKADMERGLLDDMLSEPASRSTPEPARVPVTAAPKHALAAQSAPRAEGDRPRGTPIAELMRQLAK